jgi:adenylate kinase family enzyme
LKQDEEAIVLKRVEGYTKNLNLIEESFKNCLYTIDASLEIEKVTEKIEYAINNGV